MNVHDIPLLRFSLQDTFHVSAAFQHLLIIGSTGSGKSTGPVALFFQAMLRRGFGALALCVKPDEAKQVMAHAEAAGRLQDVMLVSPNPDPLNEGMLWRINVLEYLFKAEAGLGGIGEIVALIATLTTFVDGAASLRDQKDFWDRNGDKLVRHALTLLILSNAPLSFLTIYQLVLAAPQQSEDTDDPYFQPPDQEQFFWEVLEQARGNASTRQEQHALTIAEHYWLGEMPRLADRTRSSIIATLTSVLDVFLHGHLYELFGTETTFTPEQSFTEGNILVLDMPIQGLYGETGRIAQLLIKHLWQKAVLRRNVQEQPRPVALLADEAQEIVSSSDYSFLSTARSAHAAVLYATQNISNIYAKIGHMEKDAADALLGLFNTKVFLANGDPVTNQWASTLIGFAEQTRQSWTVDRTGQLALSGTSKPDFIIPPWTFTQLQKGGRPTYAVEGIVFQNGRRWQASNAAILRVLFPQQLPAAQQALMVVDASQELSLTEEDKTKLILQYLVMLVALIEELMILNRHPSLLVSQAQESYAPPPPSQVPRAISVVSIDEAMPDDDK